MTSIVPFAQTGGEMPVIDLGHGETITALEFLSAVQSQAPIALRHEGWLKLVKMAFLENRVDALHLAKQQAAALQQSVGEPMGMMTPLYQPQPFPTTYYQPQPQPIIFCPQITVSPSINPQVTPTITTSSTIANPSQNQPSHQTYHTTTDLSLWQFIGLLFATAAILIVVLG